MVSVSTTQQCWHPRLLSALGRLEFLAACARLWGPARLWPQQQQQGYQWLGQPRARSRAQSRGRRSYSRPPQRRPPNEPPKAAPKADAYQHMYRGQGARIKRTARRALQKAGLEVPESLKPGKAITDLPEPEKAEVFKPIFHLPGGMGGQQSQSSPA